MNSCASAFFTYFAFTLHQLPKSTLIVLTSAATMVHFLAYNRQLVVGWPKRFPVPLPWHILKKHSQWYKIAVLWDVITCSLAQKYSRKPIICAQTIQFPDYSCTCGLGFNPLPVPYSSFGGGMAWVGFWNLEALHKKWSNNTLFFQLFIVGIGEARRFIPIVMVHWTTWYATDITLWDFVCWISQLRPWFLWSRHQKILIHL